MNKFKSAFGSIFPILFVSALMGFFVVGVYAASTIGTNMVTTGTMHIGDGSAQTKFEVQGTASSSYILTGNTIQVGGFASAAYNRLGTTATTHGHYIAGSDDLMIGGDLEVRATVSFAGAASFSQAFWIGTNGKTGNVGVGTNAPTTKFAVSGSASVSTDFEVGGVASAATLISKTSLLASSGRSASSSTIYVAEFGTAKTATVSVLFGGNSSTAGTCLQLKDTAGNWVYARVNIGGTAFVINTNECHTGL